MARRFFGSVEVRFYHLTSLAAAPFVRWRLFDPLLSALDAVDSLLLKVPGLRYQAWTTVLALSEPRGH
jgi:hypothetical protein